MSSTDLSEQSTLEASNEDERRPIFHQNGGGAQPNGLGMELGTNYNSMTNTNPPYYGRESAVPLPPPQPYNPESYDDNDESCKECMSCLQVGFLLCSCCLLGVVVALLGIILFAGAMSLLEHLPPNTCTSAQCYIAAGEILASLKVNVSPCDDFPQFACGGWQREHPLPESKFHWGILESLDEKTLLDVQSLLEAASKKEEPPTIRATKIVYQACVNASQWEEAGATPLLDLLDGEGGLPMVEPDWDKSRFDLMSRMSRLRRILASQYLVSVTVEADSKNTSRSAIYLSQGELPLPREYYTPDTPLSRYHKKSRIALMRQAGESLLRARNQERDKTYLDRLYQDVDDLWDFSVKLAEITELEAPDPWQLYNPMAVNEIQNLTDTANPTFKVDWLEYLNEIFNETEIHLKGTQTVVVDRPSYFARLVTLLKQSPARALANYLLFPLVIEMGNEVEGDGPSSSPPLRTDQWSLGRHSTRTWYDCARKVRIMLPFGVGALYTRQRHALESQRLAQEVVRDVSGAFREMLMEASWLDNETLKAALLKLDEMQQLVAFPDQALNDTLLEEYHKGMPEMSADDHFGNILALTAWHCRRSLLSFNSPPQRDSWPRGSLELNAFYSPWTNAIAIPLAMLQPPVFIPENLTALNYGSLGAIIGHETIHGFDTKGRMRDAHGNLNHWWTNATLNQYLNRTHCFVKQYSSYNASPLLPPYQRPDTPLMINGERTVSENVADNGGLRAAWGAYQRRVEMQGRRPGIVLPGLENFTDDQLFFISFAKVWCSQVTPFALQYMLLADVHVPEPFRVLGTLRNSPAFAKAFNCPSGSPMNPKEKCKLW